MSLVDIHSPTAEDQIMDPAIKHYVDSSLNVSEARNDGKLAEFRATMEGYTARAEERDAAAREREAILAANFRATMEAYTKLADERDAAAKERDAATKEREAILASDFRASMAAHIAWGKERDAAAKEEALLHAAENDRRIASFEAMVAGVKRAVIMTGIGATLSTVFGVAAFNAALIQNVQAAFESGRQASPAQIKMQADIDEIKRQLTELRAHQKPGA